MKIYSDSTANLLSCTTECFSYYECMVGYWIIPDYSSFPDYRSDAMHDNQFDY